MGITVKTSSTPVKTVNSPSNRVPAPTGIIHIKPEASCQAPIVNLNEQSKAGTALNFIQREQLLEYKLREEIARAIAAETHLQVEIDEIELINTEFIRDIYDKLSKKLNIDSTKYIKVVANKQEIEDNIDYFNFASDEPTIPNYGDTVFNEEDEEYYKLIDRDTCT